MTPSTRARAQGTRFARLSPLQVINPDFSDIMGEAEMKAEMPAEWDKDWAEI